MKPESAPGADNVTAWYAQESLDGFTGTYRPALQAMRTRWQIPGRKKASLVIIGGPDCDLDEEWVDHFDDGMVRLPLTQRSRPTASAQCSALLMVGPQLTLTTNDAWSHHLTFNVLS